MSIAAQKAKAKGNAAFRAENFPEAVGHYTEAMLADGTDATYPLNRAAAYLRLGKAVDAERDCSTALQLSPGHVKALYRRAQARMELGKLSEAKADLAEALRREPGNTAVKSEIQKVDKLLSERGKFKTSPTDVGDIPKQAPPRRRRVPIEIVEDDASSVGRKQATDDTLTPISSRSLKPKPEEALPTPLPSPAREPLRKTDPDDSSQFSAPAKSVPTVQGGIFRPSGQHTLFRTPEPSQSTTKPAAVPSGRPNVKSDESSQPSPLSLFEFTRSWGLASPSERWDLLCKTPPQTLPSLFKTALEASLLVQILEACSLAVKSADEPAIKDRVREYLRWFQRVPRFSTVALFLSKQEKELARVLADTVQTTEWKI